MIKLSDRLECILQMIEKGEKVADIGTDHGLIPFSLWEQGISPLVIMGDISKGSLHKAKENGKLFFPETDFIYRLGDGIKVIEDSEVDVIVIAGIGGSLMVDILGENLKKTKSIKKFILQPRNRVDKVRKFLLENDFYIKEETLVTEGKYICEIMLVETANEENGKNIKKEKEDFSLGKIKTFLPVNLKKEKLPLYKEYLKKNIEKEKYILEKQQEGKNSKGKIMETKNKLEVLEREYEIS